MPRVVTSDRAEELLGSLQREIGQVHELLQQMLRLGDELATPQVWEGQAANRFRDGEWAQTRTWANNSITQLTELRGTIQRINDNIRDAGGGHG